jgi:hypothetical protein
VGRTERSAKRTTGDPSGTLGAAGRASPVAADFVDEPEPDVDAASVAENTKSAFDKPRPASRTGRAGGGGESLLSGSGFAADWRRKGGFGRFCVSSGVGSSAGSGSSGGGSLGFGSGTSIGKNSVVVAGAGAVAVGLPRSRMSRNPCMTRLEAA